MNAIATSNASDSAALESLGEQLLGTPVYIALESEGAPAPMPDAYGCTARTMDLLLRTWLESNGRWRGRRPAVYLGDELLRANIAAEFPADVDQQLARWLAPICLHELAHVVDQGIDRAEVTPETHEKALMMAAFSNAIVNSQIYPPWLSHDGQWARLVPHVTRRAAAMGLAIDVDDIFSGHAYGIAEPSEFQYALLGEERALANESIFDIQHFRPPRLFVDLWRRCVTTWIEANADRASERYVRQSLNLFSQGNEAPC